MFTGSDPLASAGEAGLIPGRGRSAGEGHGKPLQYSGLGNPMDRGAWPATAKSVRQKLATKQRFWGEGMIALAQWGCGEVGRVPTRRVS